MWLANSYLTLSKLGIDKIEKDATYNENNSIACAIIFNIKHSIELILKCLTVTASTGESYEQKHDLRKLSILLRKVSRTKSQDLIKLMAIAEKYYNLDFWGGKLKQDGFCDSENEVFRYPTSSKGGYVLDMQKMKGLKPDDIMELTNDVRELERIGSRIYRIIRRKKMTLTPYHQARLIVSICSPRRSKRKVSLWNN